MMVLFSAVLILGAALNSQTVLGWCFALAVDNARPMLVVAGLSLVVTIVVLPAVISTYGRIAAPTSWLFVNLIGIFVPGVIAARRMNNPWVAVQTGTAIVAAIAAPAILLVALAS